ncbi:unnamed protein product [Rhizophagus irregularis]|uniref:Uncharacterized protein n=1 Tax=Rhizophagus irregularis TaxID=588596 RepID=A0A2I1G5T1_9GLOM|nr:hypothetical protein RhiirA4_455616 [Rhizophagus irregularis]CAB4409154.1 unnamed protein product [Rhizophagus irregularis]CAB4409529.1 unnamed protein product [Rhizophagus irregularis]
MFKPIIAKYLSEMKYEHWPIISILKYTKSKCRLYSDSINDLKSNIYASLRSYRENDNHVNVNNKLNKIITDFEKSFSTAEVKEFIDKLQEEQEERSHGYNANQILVDELKGNDEYKKFKRGACCYKASSVFQQDQIVKGNEDTLYERRQRCSTPEDKIKTVNLDEVPSAMITISLYVPSSPSTPDCNISEEYIIVENRSYSMDYLTDPSVPEYRSML